MDSCPGTLRCCTQLISLCASGRTRTVASSLTGPHQYHHLLPLVYLHGHNSSGTMNGVTTESQDGLAGLENTMPNACCLSGITLNAACAQCRVRTMYCI
ncbi:hypothetical protein NCU16688 [Neurospora crassa OR74A]|uniref:Uncharacterized protein n=1 Tax=Neurospora crassa (strain ATCC 24698 / 74-OR23-1A / CBS 708.71 / DSM 1257 / FGSC 987) TaxID=367110 RepID=U9WH59_NEUCR|nr:hypothetical protein NCU16688 [Neurospora crassa OR74A]ESA43423.1 hypothetical protein NCU16688 [Neurospora crassa OR74A]|eukprot:XP_011394060.1 hypothetical protein NCU16688 [Neurospora crassa OR74A]